MEFNRKSFVWGRRAAVDLERVRRIAMPADVIPIEQHFSRNLDELLERRAEFLTGYQDAAYAARYVAKNVVAAGFADRCTLQLAYAIGVARPLSIYIDTHGTGTVGDDKIEEAIMSIDKLGGLTPRAIRTHLGLNKPIYRKTAAYGHFGRTAEGDFFPWEKTDLVEDLKAALA